MTDKYSQIPPAQSDDASREPRSPLGNPGKNEAHFRLMVDTLPVPVCEFDFSYRVTYANQAALKWMGYEPEAVRSGVNIFDLLPGHIRPVVEERIKLLAKGGDPGPLEMDFLKRDGKVRYGVAYPAPVFEGDAIVGVRTCFMDLTERRKAEIDLQESETRFRTLFNGLNDAVFLHPFVKEGFGTFMEVNDVACKRYGYTREELLELTPWRLIAGYSRADLGSRPDREQLREMGRRTIEMEHRKKSGETFPVEMLSSVFDFHGEKLILTAVRDITDRKLREQERADAAKLMAEQEKYALVGQVAGKMAHDFNNILGGIMGNAEVSLMDCRQPEIRETLDIILKQTLRGRNLTKNLVAFAKDQEPKEAYFNLNEKIGLVLNLLKKDLDAVRLVKDFSLDMPELLADPGMIEHALVNLIQNAIHAVSLEPDPEIDIRTRLGKTNLIIEIRDNGCGIPEKFHKDIYSPSFTLKGGKDILGAYRPHIKGTGYGMANVKKYIEKHKGAISFTSKEGEGSCFVLSIPVIKKELTPREKYRITQSFIARAKQILLVEDEPAISGVQQKILSQEPFFHRVTLARTGQEAMERFDAGGFDLVSLDYVLPGRLSGLDVYRHIRSKDRKVPILFVSGNIGFLESIKEMQETDPLMDHLPKPCENILYADTVNAWLAKTQQPDGG